MEFYNSLLESMQAKYKELSGSEADEASDIGIRLRVLAGEIDKLYEQMSGLESELFPQTSSGKYLDLHAELRGIERKPKTAATGMIRFVREDLAGDLNIPNGTLVGASGDRQDYYRTAKSAVISTGQKELDVPAWAVADGSAGNAAVGRINLLVSNVPGIVSVRNVTPFSGGCDAESDDELRKRVVESYHNPSNTVNAAYYYNYAVSSTKVGFAKIIPRINGRGSVGVIICAVPEENETEIVTKLNEEFRDIKEICVDVKVRGAVRDFTDVSLQIETDGVFDQRVAQESAVAVTREFVNNVQIGEPLRLNQLGKKILEIEGVVNYKFAQPLKDVVPLPDHVVRSGSISAGEWGE